jgi:hypothetical protein
LSVRQVIQLPKEVVLFGRAFEKPIFFFLRIFSETRHSLFDFVIFFFFFFTYFVKLDTSFLDFVIFFFFFFLRIFSETRHFLLVFVIFNTSEVR